MIMNKSDSKGDDLSSRKIGLIFAASLGIAGTALVALATPFILPALRKHCLPFVPATEIQLENLSHAFKKHTKSRGTYTFIDIGSGDGRICRLANETNLYKQIDGVELNSLLVFYSRLKALRDGDWRQVKFHRRDLWKFSLNKYDAICIFGVDSMMDPLEKYLREKNFKKQTIYACRFPFKHWKPVDEIGNGIDTVWVYNLNPSIRN